MACPTCGSEYPLTRGQVGGLSTRYTWPCRDTWHDQEERLERHPQDCRCDHCLPELCSAPLREGPTPERQDTIHSQLAALKRSALNELENAIIAASNWMLDFKENGTGLPLCERALGEGLKKCGEVRALALADSMLDDGAGA